MAVFGFLFSRLTGRHHSRQSDRHDSPQPDQDREQEQEQEQQEKPHQHRKSFGFFRGKGKAKAKAAKKHDTSSERESVDGEDIQREAMIRKSLASRASSRNTKRMSRASTRRMSRASFGTTNTNITNNNNSNNNINNNNNNNNNNPDPVQEAASTDSEEEEDDDDSLGELRDEPSAPSSSRRPKRANLKTDWKAYEANLQRNRSVLIRSHPGIDRSVSMPVSSSSQPSYRIPRRPVRSNPTSPVGRSCRSPTNIPTPFPPTSTTAADTHRDNMYQSQNMF